MSKPLKIFITYAHKDTKAKDELITHLAVLKREGLIDIWHDNEILPGDKWHDAIFSNLDDSDILLYLTSAYSLDSENCNKELAAALDADTKIRVIPIILDHCDWKNHQLSDFQALPDKGKPITDSSVWKCESEGWQNVAEGIRKVVTKIQVQAKSSPRITPEEMETLSNVKLQQGNFLMMLKQMDQAIAAYLRAIDLNPNNTGAYNNRGIAYGVKDELDRALEDFDKAIELNPKLADAYNNRGNAYRIKGEFDRAFEDFDKAIELNPKLADAYNGRGAAYREKCEFDRALEDFDKAIELDPELAETYNNRGIAYRIKGEFDRALEDYNKAIELNPKLAGVYVNRGDAYSAKGEFDRALEDYNKAIELNPKLAEVYVNRGNAYSAKGEFDRAFEDYNKAIELNPKLAETYNNRGAAYTKKGDFDNAIKDFTTAIKHQPDNADAYNNRGIIWLHLQRWENFRSDLSDARDVGIDIAIRFRNVYGSVANFERITEIQLPEDIAAMLTPPQK